MHAHANVLSYLETSSAAAPQALAVIEGDRSLTYAALEEQGKRIASSLARRADTVGHAVVILIEKGCVALEAMMGVLYAGAHYVVVDPSTPEERMGAILDRLGRPLVVVDRTCVGVPAAVASYDAVVDVSDLWCGDIDHRLLETIRGRTLETDPAYVMFTSGSTGVPKGVAVSHRAIMSFIDAFVEVVGIRAGDRVANQAPFDFDLSVKDIFGSFAVGATVVVVPRHLFMCPSDLMGYLVRQRASVLIWAVAALCMVSSYHALDAMCLPDLRIVAFSGEVMPSAHLRAWRKGAPGATFFNLYGPTEVTCNCMYLRLEADCDYEDGIPLGTTFPHCDVLLVGDDGREVREPHVEAEIVVRGPSLALGYVGDPELTRASFPLNPLNAAVPERVYRTGDMAVLTEAGQVLFRGRRDTQVKHMGHRIELGDIEAVAERVPGVWRCRCAYDREHMRLCAFFEGGVTEAALRRRLARRLPAYMSPSVVMRVDDMPLNENGKVDRGRLLELARH